MSQTIDAHCHLADPRLDPIRDEVFTRATEAGVVHFIQGGTDPDDWDRQLELRERHPDALSCTFGLHPWWVASHREPEIDEALRLLEDYLPLGVAAGETGLDFGSRIKRSTHALQLRAFQRQLALARAADKPLVLHIVHAHAEALELLKASYATANGGIVHAFAGSAEIARAYIACGLTISVGGAVTREGRDKLRNAVASIPLERLVIESDAPDQPPENHLGELNEPAHIWEVAETIASLRGISAEEVLDASRENLSQLFGIHLAPS